MPGKLYQLDGVGEITIHRHRRAKVLKIAITADNKIRITQPYWLPYKAGLEYAKSKREWVNLHHKAADPFYDGQQIGKYHRIKFLFTGKHETTIRISSNTINVFSYNEAEAGHSETQEKIRIAVNKALKKEAEKLLVPRVRDLSGKHELSYKSLSFRKLKSRWGSCSSDNHLTLNIFLMTLPWELIDYVILHELTHTREHNHSPKFWSAMQDVCPDYKALRSRIKQMRPTL